ncbi:MAG: hypothetical protein ACTHMK_13885 [Dyella sp.]|uniref:hypothetical protein n=1 Tax=Dyella sp. TaxID=1869338 RepID=UPI003F7E23D2
MSTELQARSHDHQHMATASSGQLLATSETAGTAVAAQAKALVEARYTVALRFPRNEDEVRQKLLKECLRPSFAAVAIYRKPIGQGIEGPSIRFAEAAIRMMKNITVETATMYDDREKRIVRVTVTDLEANVPYSQDVTIEKTVERRNVKATDTVIRSRLNSQGNTVHIIEATEDDILNKQNALISKAIRTQGLRLVPGDLIDEALYTVRQTMKNKDAQDPDQAKRNLFDAFAQLGVGAGELAKWLGHKGESLTPKELQDLRGIYAAIRDSETTWREVMEAKDKDGEQSGTGTSAGQPAAGRGSKLRDAVGKPPAETSPGAGDGDGDGVHFTAQEVHDALAAAATLDKLNEAADLIRNLPEAEKPALQALFKQREKQLAK